MSARTQTRKARFKLKASNTHGDKWSNMLLNMTLDNHMKALKEWYYKIFHASDAGCVCLPLKQEKSQCPALRKMLRNLLWDTLQN